MSERIFIKKMGINGEGIGYLDKTVVFIPNALVGEEIEVMNLVKVGSYYTAEVAKIINKSPYRVIPKCKIYNKCQVCSLMPLDYAKQVEVKKQHLFDTVYKYAGYKIKVDKFISPEDTYNYRNSIKLPLFNLHDKLAVGIHFRDTNHFVYLKDCIVQDPTINKITSQVLSILDDYRYKAYDRKTKLGIRFLLIRYFNGEAIITFVVGKNTRIIEDALDRIKDINYVKSINQTTNTKSSNEIIVEPIKNIYGKKTVNVEFNHLNLKLSPASFMQLNTKQAVKLYDVIKGYLGKDNKLVLDLYCGIGSITTYIADSAEEIIGIDINRSSINDAKENAKKHRCNNLKFICDDVDKVIKNVAKKKSIDAIIVDPPRVGLSEYTIESIIRSKPKKFIYVSCNPSTLGKDLNILLRYFDIEKTIIVDMFPHTIHIETAVLLKRKK